MSSETGKFTSCDYPGCAEWCFSKLVLKDGSVEERHFKDLPSGWGYIDGRDLCPKHYAQRIALVNDFYRETE